MKKLIVFLSVVVLTTISANIFAQSTGIAPNPGTTHTYSVTDPGGTSYVWQVYKGSMSTEITTFPGDGITSFTATANEVVINWATDAVVNDEYIIVVTETVTATSCSNSKGLTATITASNFDLIVASGGNACYTNPVDISWDGGTDPEDITYDHGEATITYTVQGTGIGAGETWSFSLDMSYTQTMVESSVTVEDGSSSTVTPSGGIYTLTGPQTATVTIVVDNQNSYDNNSGADAQDFTATLDLSDISSGTGSLEISTANNSDNVSVSRPNTSQISF